MAKQSSKRSSKVKAHSDKQPNILVIWGDDIGIRI